MSEQELTREEKLSLLLRVCGRRLYHSSCAGRTQSRVLQLLAEGDMSQREMQERLQVQPGSISELVSKLEFKGLLTRRRNENDHRKVMLSLTDEGRLISQDELRRSEMKVDFSGLSWEEQGQLIALLEKLIDNWREEGLPESELTLGGRGAQ